MPPREQRDHRALDDRVLAHNHFAEFRPQRGRGLAEGLDLLFSTHIPGLVRTRSTASHFELNRDAVERVSTLIVTLLLKVIEVVLHRALVSARDFLLAEGALGVRLRGGGG